MNNFKCPTLSNLIYMLHINQYAVSEYVILRCHGPMILVAPASRKSHVTDNCTRKRPANITPYLLSLEEYMKIKPPYLLSLEEYMKIKQQRPICTSDQYWSIAVISLFAYCN